MNIPEEEEIDLADAKNAVNKINKQLAEFNKKKGCDYKIDINYFYKMDKTAKVSAHHRVYPKTLVMCIFRNNICVSSMIIDYYNGAIEIFSRTKRGHDGNKLNKLLRAVIIIIGKNIHTDAAYIRSEAANPISAYLMVKYFNAEDPGGKVEFSTYEEFRKYAEKHGNLMVTVTLNDVNIENAKKVFDKILNDDDELKCTKKTRVKYDRFKHKTMQQNKDKYTLKNINRKTKRIFTKM
jgi:hypothetical protein